MVDIVTEVFLLESYISSHPSSVSIRDSTPYYYAGIFQKNDTNASEFESTFECYLLDRDQMNRLLDDVLSILSIAQSQSQEPKDSGIDNSLEFIEEQEEQNE